MELIPAGTENMNKYFQITFLIKEIFLQIRWLRTRAKCMTQEKNNC